MILQVKAHSEPSAAGWTSLCPGVAPGERVAVAQRAWHSATHSQYFPNFLHKPSHRTVPHEGLLLRLSSLNHQEASRRRRVVSALHLYGSIYQAVGQVTGREGRGAQVGRRVKAGIADAGCVSLPEHRGPCGCLPEPAGPAPGRTGHSGSAELSRAGTDGQPGPACHSQPETSLSHTTPSTKHSIGSWVRDGLPHAQGPPEVIPALRASASSSVQWVCCARHRSWSVGNMGSVEARSITVIVAHQALTCCPRCTSPKRAQGRALSLKPGWGAVSAPLKGRARLAAWDHAQSAPFLGRVLPPPGRRLLQSPGARCSRLSPRALLQRRRVTLRDSPPRSRCRTSEGHTCRSPPGLPGPCHQVDCFDGHRPGCVL